MNKKLIVSLKTSSQVLNDFKKAFKASSKRPPKSPHYEISFDDKKNFEKFVKNIDMLMAIKKLRPSSVYELAKLMGRDQSNVNKLIAFFESCGVIHIEVRKINNRTVKSPVVDYQKIEFDLVAA